MVCGELGVWEGEGGCCVTGSSVNLWGAEFMRDGLGTEFDYTIDFELMQLAMDRVEFVSLHGILCFDIAQSTVMQCTPYSSSCVVHTYH
jgi:hypothetical protein